MWDAVDRWVAAVMCDFFFGGCGRNNFSGVVGGWVGCGFYCFSGGYGRNNFSGCGYLFIL